MTRETTTGREDVARDDRQSSRGRIAEAGDEKVTDATSGNEAQAPQATPCGEDGTLTDQDLDRVAGGWGGINWTFEVRPLVGKLR